MPLILTALIGLLGLLIPASAYALQVDGSSVNILCSILPCTSMGGGAAGLSAYALDKIVTGLEVGIVAVAIIFLFISAVQMVAFSTDEAVVKDSRTSYIYIITGLVIVALARWLVNAFSPTETGANLVNGAIVESAVGNVITYIKMIVALTLLVNIVVQAIRLISSQGQDEQVTKAKGRMIAGFVGAGIIMLANVMVTSSLPGASGSTAIAMEIAGLANYIIVIIGFLSVVAIVVAGGMLIVSVDEGLKEKAKTIVKTCVVALIVVLVSYALVTGFISV